MTFKRLPALPTLPTTKTARMRRLPTKPQRPSDPTPDPLAGLTHTGDLAADSATELTALQEAYRSRAKNEAKRFLAATDSEYWFAVCFTSREEKNAFLQKIGLGGPRDPDKYIPADLLTQVLRLDT